MPELPEVETLRRGLARAVTGRRIKSVEIRWPKMTRPLSPAEFARRLQGEKITGAARRAKILILKLSGGDFLLSHLKLTGQLIFVPRRGKALAGGHPQAGGTENLPNRFTRAIFSFTDGARLFMNDSRKFGWLKLMAKSDMSAWLARLGREPLEKNFTFGHFQKLLRRYPKRKIKQLLLDQTLIAGIGNIYADESCFRAKILPTRRSGTLAEKEIRALHRAIIAILKLAIKKGGTSADTYVRLDGRPGGFLPYLKVYGRKGKKCKRCSAEIKKIKLAGRGTHFCPRCQQ